MLLLEWSILLQEILLLCTCTQVSRGKVRMQFNLCSLHVFKQVKFYYFECPASLLLAPRLKQQYYTNAPPFHPPSHLNCSFTTHLFSQVTSHRLTKLMKQTNKQIEEKSVTQFFVVEFCLTNQLYLRLRLLLFLYKSSSLNTLTWHASIFKNTQTYLISNFI